MARRKPELVEMSVEGLGEGERWKVRVRLPLEDGWTAEYDVIEQNGQPVIGALHYVPSGALPLGGLTARTARVPWSVLLDEARKLVRREQSIDKTGTVRAFSYVRRKPLVRQPGRRKRADVDYARVAAAYLAAIARGSRSPVADVAAAHNDRRDYIRDMLDVARERGLLTRPPSGRAGGTLTAEAKALLAPRAGASD